MDGDGDEVTKQAEPGAGRRLTGAVRVADESGVILREGAIRLEP